MVVMAQKDGEHAAASTEAAAVEQEGISAPSARFGAGMKEDGSPLQVIVLGMHRSGTSALTGALERMGLLIGAREDLTEPNWENPQGFFERTDARSICDALLLGNDADWWKISGFDPENAHPAVVREQRPKIADLIQRLDAHNMPWALKDPRLCLLLPIFRSVLTRPFVLIVYRHPVEVARSLRRRNGFPIRAGLALWEGYMTAALQHGARGAYRLVSYNKLVDKPGEVLASLMDAFKHAGVENIQLDKAVAGINSGLRSECLAPDEKLDLLSDAQRLLWERLNNEGDFSDPPVLSTEGFRVLKEFEPDETARQDLRKEVSKLKSRTNALYRELDAGKAREAERDQLLKEATASRASDREKIATLEKALKEKDRKADRLLAERSDLIEKIKRGETKLKEAEQRTVRIDKELAETQVELSAASSNAAILRNQLSTTNHEVDMLWERLSAKQEEINSVNGKLETVNVSLAEANKKLLSKKRQLAKSNYARSVIEEQTSHLEREIQSFQQVRAWQRSQQLSVFAQKLGLAKPQSAPRLLSDDPYSRRCERLKKTRLFDQDWYIARNAPLSGEAEDSIRHYLEAGSAGKRDPHVLFCQEFYLTQASISDGRTPLEHYLDGDGWEYTPHPLFDTKYYLSQIADGETDDLTPLEHFLRKGVELGCNPHPAFDSGWYLQRYPDIAAKGINPLAHFLRSGAKEGRNPNPSFDTRDYQRRYPDLALHGLNPLVHFVLKGREPNKSGAAELRNDTARAYFEAVSPAYEKDTSGDGEAS